MLNPSPIPSESQMDYVHPNRKPLILAIGISTILVAGYVALHYAASSSSVQDTIDTVPTDGTD